MDPEQQERFKRAVERKEHEADQRAQAPGAQAAEDELPPKQHEEIGPRDKNSRHGQVTADKWNQ